MYHWWIEKYSIVGIGILKLLSRLAKLLAGEEVISTSKIEGQTFENWTSIHFLKPKVGIAIVLQPLTNYQITIHKSDDALPFLESTTLWEH